MIYCAQTVECQVRTAFFLFLSLFLSLSSSSNASQCLLYLCASVYVARSFSSILSIKLPGPFYLSLESVKWTLQCEKPLKGHFLNSALLLISCTACGTVVTREPQSLRQYQIFALNNNHIGVFLELLDWWIEFCGFCSILGGQWCCVLICWYLIMSYSVCPAMAGTLNSSCRVQHHRWWW